MNTMTPRERILAAMKLQKPDRIPVMCQFSFGHMLQQLNVSSSELWFDMNTFADGLLTLQELYKFDGILTSLHGHKKNWRDEIIRFERNGEKEILTFENKEMIFNPDELPMVKHLIATEKKKMEDINIEDIPDEISYIPVSQDLHFEIDLDNKLTIYDSIHERVNQIYSIHGEVTSPFDYFLDYLGYENALMALIENAEKSKSILQKFTDGIVQLSSEMCTKPVDAIKISSPYAGMGFISTNMYREFVLPYESQIIKVIKDRGKFAYIHTCGAINDRLEIMQESGASGLECLDPPPIGNVELEEAIGRIGDEMFIKGNIDSVHTLLQGSWQELTNDIIKRINAGKSTRGFILSTACSIAPHVPRERIQLLVQLAEKYGKYEVN